MTHSEQQTAAARALPARPNLEHLKNEAKARLDQLRLTDPKAQLSQAQFRLAREYGFSSWRELKAKVDANTVATPTAVDPAGDWIGEIPGNRIALHVRRSEDGYRATTDAPDHGVYDERVDDFLLEDGTLSFSHLEWGTLFESRWDATAQAWTGEWKGLGMSWPLALTRGIFPPAPVVPGLDGLWDGILRDAKGEEKRFSFVIRTGEHGTHGRFQSPDTDVRQAPLQSIAREDDTVTLRMKSFTVAGPLSDAGDVIDGEFRKNGWAGPLVLTRRRPGAAPPQRSRPADIELPAHALQRFVGVYSFSQGRTLVVRMEDGRLVGEFDGAPPLALTPIRPTEFRFPVGESGVGFVLDEDGQIESVQIMLEHYRDRGVRLPQGTIQS